VPTAAAAALLALLLAAGSGSPRPSVRAGDLHGPVPGDDGGRVWQVPVGAVDRDGSVVSFEVDWGDGSTLWVTTACGPVGEAVGLRLPHEYRRQGTYRFRVRATSVDHCAHPRLAQLSGWAARSFAVGP
jgi:hypothetical protein